MKNISEALELLQCFRPSDQKNVFVPETLKFPLAMDAGYQSWMDPSGARVYLVFRSDDSENSKFLGLSFRRSPPHVEMAAMCEWCHSVRRGQISLLTCESSEKKSVGLYLCHDLSCQQKIHQMPDPSDFRESVDEDLRSKKILERIRSFAKRCLY